MKLKYAGIDADKLKVAIVEQDIEIGMVLSHPNAHRWTLLKQNFETILQEAVDRLGVDDVERLIKASGHFKTNKRKAA